MRIPRIYHPESLKNQSTCQLSEDAANHVGRVLRMTEGEQLNYLMVVIIFIRPKLLKRAKKPLKWKF